MPSASGLIHRRTRCKERRTHPTCRKTTIKLFRCHRLHWCCGLTQLNQGSFFRDQCARLPRVRFFYGAPLRILLPHSPENKFRIVPEGSNLETRESSAMKGVNRRNVSSQVMKPSHTLESQGAATFPASSLSKVSGQLAVVALTRGQVYAHRSSVSGRRNAVFSVTSVGGKRSRRGRDAAYKARPLTCQSPEEAANPRRSAASSSVAAR